MNNRLLEIRKLSNVNSGPSGKSMRPRILKSMLLDPPDGVDFKKIKQKNSLKILK